MARHTYSSKLKAQVGLEVLSGEKTPGQVAKAYGVHPNSVQLWKRRFLGASAPDLLGEGGRRPAVAVLRMCLGDRLPTAP